MIPGDADNDNDYVDIMVSTYDTGQGEQARTNLVRLVLEAESGHVAWFSIARGALYGHNKLAGFTSRSLYAEDV